MSRAKMIFSGLLLALFMISPALAGIVNSKATEFTLQDLNGKPVSLSDFRGKVVFIDFWASWCPPCKKEFPELNSFIRDYAPDAVVLAVNVDKKRSHVDDFLSRMPGLSGNFHILLDPESKIIPKYGARAMPTSFILDKEGVIRYAHYGYRDDDAKEWAAEIESLLK